MSSTTYVADTITFKRVAVWRKILMAEKIDEFDEFFAIHTFTIQSLLFNSCLHACNVEFVKILLVNFFLTPNSSKFSHISSHKVCDENKEEKNDCRAKKF